MLWFSKPSTFFLSLHLALSVGFPRFYGEWMLWHSTSRDLPDNRVVIHIYPDDQLSMKYRFMKGPIVFHKSKTGTFKIKEHHQDKERQLVQVSFHKTEEVFLSVYGIGLQNFNIKTKKKFVETNYEFAMNFVGVDDIYLQSTTHHDDCYHIVKSARINEPSVDIPISTFLITQIIGCILGHMINEFLFHTN